MELADLESIDAIFANVGASTLEVALLPPKGTNPTTRCAFVRVDVDVADTVCEGLNGASLVGHPAPLVVRVAQNQGAQPQPPRGGAPLTVPVTSILAGSPPPGIMPPPPPVNPHAAQATLRSRTSNGVMPGAMRVLPQALDVLVPKPAVYRTMPPAIGVQPAASNGVAAAFRAKPSSGPPAKVASAHLAGVAADPAAVKERAMVAGEWRTLADLQESEYAAAGETVMDRVQRLSEALGDAVANGYFYEAAAVFETLALLDPVTAAEANSQAIARLSGSEAEVAPDHHPPAAPDQHPAPGLPLQPHVNEVSEQVYSGIITNFNWEKHYGFIQSEELGQDAFVSDKQIGSFQAGDHVFFQVAYNSKGKPQAQNLAYYQNERDAVQAGRKPSSFIKPPTKPVTVSAKRPRIE